MLTHACQALRPHLPLEAEGYKCTTDDLLNALLGVAANQGTVLSVCRDLVGTPDAATVRRYFDMPVLALFGGKHVQVPAEQNAAALEAALKAAGNTDYQLVVFPDANHVFQQAATGSFSEYASLPAVFLPDFLPTITDWRAAQGLNR